MSVYGWYRYWKSNKTHKFKVWPAWLSILLLLGVGLQISLTFLSGMKTQEGIRFYGINFHDGLWHVALMETLKKPFPPSNPTFSGLPLQGYHYLIDLFGSELSRVFLLDPLWLTYRFLPLLFSLLGGLGVYLVMRRFKASSLGIFTAVFLSYFGASFAYLLPFLKLNANPDESAFWAQQSISTFINLPLGVSFALLTVILILLFDWLKRRKRESLWLAAVLVGALVGIKAYGGMLAVVGFSGFLLLSVRKINASQLLIPFGLMLLVATMLIIPTMSGVEKPFIYEPGWFLKTMMEAGDRVFYPKWEILRLTYLQHNNIPRLIQLWGNALLVFIIGNFGVRIFGFLYLFKHDKQTVKKIFPIHGFMILVAATGIIIPLLFLQAGTVWNTIQFLYYSLWIMAIYSGLFISDRKKLLGSILVMVIVILSLPTNIITIKSYLLSYLNDDYELVDHWEMEALSYVKQLDGNEIILSPFSETAYLPALSGGHQVYFADPTQAYILLIDPNERTTQIRQVFEECKPEPDVENYMKNNNIKYLYSNKRISSECSDKFDHFSILNKIYSNQTISIYEYR